MDSGQESEQDSAPTQAYDIEGHHQLLSNVLNEYYIVDGPEKQKEDMDSRVSEMSEDISRGRSRSSSNQSGGGMQEVSDADNKNKENDKIQDQKASNIPSLKETNKPPSSQHVESSGQTKCPVPIPVVCPPVDCKEKIIICLDLSEEMNKKSFRSRAGDKFSGLELAKRALKMFIMHKSQMNTAHEFAFMIFTEEPTMKFQETSPVFILPEQIQGFSSRPQDLLNTLEETEMLSQECGPLNLSKMFETIQQNVELPSLRDNVRVIPPPFIVRLLVIFGRSYSVPVEQGKQAQKALETSPYFFVDVLYIHEPPSDENKCEEIFSKLCELDHTGLSYILEASKYTPIFTSGAKLLAHPLQRPLQEQAAYKIGSLPVPQMIDERII